MQDNNKPSQYRYKDKNRNRISKKDRHTGTQKLSVQDAIKIKLKQVFFPYLGLSILTILLFGALRWVLDIYLDILPLKEDYWNFGIPCFLSIVVVSLWMWPRYEPLTLKWTKRSSSGYFFLTMVLALAIPFVISQNYLSKAAYDVIEVDSLNDIRDYPKQKYFRVDDFELLKSDKVSYIETQVVGGRYFESDLNVYYYIATPFMAADNIWLGSHYYTSYDNRADEHIKNNNYDAFIDRSLNQYMSKDVSSISYFRKLKSSNERSGYLQSIAKADRQSNLPPLILVPESGWFVDSLERDLVWGLGSFVTGMVVCLLLILVADVDNTERRIDQKKVQKQVRRKVQRRDPVSNVVKDIVALFKNNKKRPATSVLMIICIVTFIFTLFMGMDIFTPLSSQIDKVGGLSTDALQAGKYWRVLTSLFVHEGIMHLAMSLFILYIAGYILEPVLGAVRFTIAFFMCGVFSNILGVLYYDIDMAGAWSAIFGLSGIAITLVVYKVFNKKNREVYGATVAVILIIILTSMFIAFIDTLSYIVYYLLTLCFGIVFGVIMVMTQRQHLLSNARRHNL